MLIPVVLLRGASDYSLSPYSGVDFLPTSDLILFLANWEFLAAYPVLVGQILVRFCHRGLVWYEYALV